MKLKTLSLNCVLLVTTMFATPSLVAAQETQPPADASSQGEEFQTEELVVRGRFIPEPMRETSEVVTLLSADDLARQGDDDAAQALTRLSGITVNRGFVFVRGLGERYSSALLNGSPLPSPDPLRRQIPLNVFPTNVLDSAVVQKTASSNYPGEFGGGIVDLRTLRQPNETFLNASIGTGWNTVSTNEKGVFVYGDGKDWTGSDDGTRDIPPALAAALSRRTEINRTNVPAAELERIGESLVSGDLWVIQSDNLDPDFEGEASAGTSIDVGRFNLGLIGAASYNHEWRTQNANRTTIIGDALASEYTVLSSSLNITTSAFGSASLGWDTHELTLTGLFVRDTIKDASIATGYDPDVIFDEDRTPNTRSDSSGWFERELSSMQFTGEHGLGDLEINWRTALSSASREAPYEIGVGYSLLPGNRVAFAGRNSIAFSELRDEVFSAGVDATYTLALDDRREAVLRGGLDYSNTVRSAERIEFGFEQVADIGNLLFSRIDFILAPQNIGPRFVLDESTGPSDSHRGRLTLNAAYLSGDVELTSFLRTALGVRFEEGRQTLRTFNRFGQARSERADIENTYFLPSGTVTWNFAEDLQLRLGYSQTIARPQFRELAPTDFFDPDADRTYQGNPFLKDSEFQNYDARLEYYFGRNQFVTVGGFYKKVENPIEEVIVPLADIFINYINAPEATIWGGEAEFRARFEMPFALPLLDGAEWLFSTNYTYTASEVSAGPNDLVRSPLAPGFALRPASDFGLDGSELQGISEHMVNAQFGYETVSSQLTLLMGWASERILQRGGGGLPDVVEDPGTQLDLVYRRDFRIMNTDFTVGLSGRNLLETERQEFQESRLGRTEFNSYERGRTFSISLSAKY